MYEEKSPIPRSKQTPVEHSSLPPLALPYDRTFCTTFRVHHANFAVYGLFLKFRGFRWLQIFFFYYIISVSKHVFSGSPELRPNQNWLYVPRPARCIIKSYCLGTAEARLATRKVHILLWSTCSHAPTCSLTIIEKKKVRSCTVTSAIALVNTVDLHARRGYSAPANRDYGAPCVRACVRVCVCVCVCARARARVCVTVITGDASWATFTKSEWKGLKKSRTKESTDFRTGWGSLHASLPGSYHDTVENGAWQRLWVSLFSGIRSITESSDSEFLFTMDWWRRVNFWWEWHRPISGQLFQCRLDADKPVVAFRRDTPFRPAVTFGEDVLNKGSPLTERRVCSNGRGVSTETCMCHSNGAGRPTQRGEWCELTDEYE